jgi:hypothetical protein
MIKKWLRPGQKLAVGKLEYQTIIEKTLVSVSFPSMLVSVISLITHFVVIFFFARDYTACSLPEKGTSVPVTGRFSAGPYDRH